MGTKKFTCVTKSEMRRITHQMVSKGYILSNFEEVNKRYTIEFCRGCEND